MVKIISDSTCDLSQELLDKYEISILPLHILLGDTECEDGINITPDEIYNWSEEHKMTPKTSAPAMDRAVDLLQPYVEKRQEVICFAIPERCLLLQMYFVWQQAIWKQKRLFL